MGGDEDGGNCDGGGGEAGFLGLSRGCSGATARAESFANKSFSSFLTLLQKPFRDSISCLMSWPGNILCSISSGTGGGGGGRRGGAAGQPHVTSASCMRSLEVRVSGDLNSLADGMSWASVCWNCPTTPVDSRTPCVVFGGLSSLSGTVMLHSHSHSSQFFSKHELHRNQCRCAGF